MKMYFINLGRHVMLKLSLDHLDFELLGTSIALESKNEYPDPDLVQLEIVWTAMEKISNERENWENVLRKLCQSSRWNIWNVLFTLGLAKKAIEATDVFGFFVLKDSKRLKVTMRLINQKNFLFLLKMTEQKAFIMSLSVL